MAPFPRGTRVSQPFGSYPNNGVNPVGGHTGKDYAVEVGTPVHAAGDGIIRHSDWFSTNYLENPWWLTQMGGDTLVLDCTDAFGRSDGYPTFVYAHLSESTANVGDRVKKGQIIGKSGNSGTATTGPHCHVEVMPPNWDWNNGTYGRINPDLYFTEYPGEVTAQGTITKEDELSAEEVKEIKAAIAEVKNVAQNTWAGVWTGGTVNGQKFNYGVLPIVAHSQAQAAAQAAQVQATLAALSNVIKQLGESKGTPVDLEAVTAAAEAGAQKALSGLSVTIKQGEAL
jgi:hypothetical protein